MERKAYTNKDGLRHGFSVLTFPDMLNFFTPRHNIIYKVHGYELHNHLKKENSEDISQPISQCFTEAPDLCWAVLIAVLLI